MDGLPIRGVIWLVGLAFINAIVEAMVTAFENIGEAAVEKKLEDGDKKAKKLLKGSETRGILNDSKGKLCWRWGLQTGC